MDPWLIEVLVLLVAVGVVIAIGRWYSWRETNALARDAAIDGERERHPASGVILLGPRDPRPYDWNRRDGDA